MTWIFVAVGYAALGAVLLYVRIRLLRRFGGSLAGLNAWTVTACVAIWPIDLIASLWRFAKLRHLLKAKR